MLYQKNSENSEINSPNKLYQSIIARTPILASNNKSFPKIILNNKFGKIGEVVDESSSIEIAKKIDFLIESDKTDYKKSLDYLSSEVSWANEEKKLLNLYSQIC